MDSSLEVVDAGFELGSIVTHCRPRLCRGWPRPRPSERGGGIGDNHQSRTPEAHHAHRFGELAYLQARERETGLSIEPTSHDFGPLDIGLESPIADQASFTVTNNGPDKSGTLAVEFQGNDPTNFGKDDGCVGKQLDAGETCPILVGFAPLDPAGDKAADLVVSSDIPADRTATASLSGVATVP